MRTLPLTLGLSVALLGCPNPTSTGSLCASMASRCGGEDSAAWETWCESECVPEFASHTACAANDVCLLCDEADATGRVTHFGLPGNDLEYLWTVADDEVEPTYPADLPTPTGGAFDDRSDSWQRDADTVGAWSLLEPYAVEFGEPTGFCEPGPNQYLSSNITAFPDSVQLAAQRLGPADVAQTCSYDRCPAGPYPACGSSFETECPYGDASEDGGMGSAAQLDRGPAGALATYGFGRYRVEERPSGSVDSQSGFVYAFFTQGNLYCEGASANTSTNTGEIDVEISRGYGRVLGREFCDENELCVQLVNWASSTQGIPEGRDRHEVSAFRFRDLEVGRSPRTFGFDWSSEDIRFVYDPTPSDCDERAGDCSTVDAPVAICRHTRFVPQRPSELHVQLWGAHWAGPGTPGTRAEMTVQRVWHEPFTR